MMVLMALDWIAAPMIGTVAAFLMAAINMDRGRDGFFAGVPGVSNAFMLSIALNASLAFWLVWAVVLR